MKQTQPTLSASASSAVFQLEGFGETYRGLYLEC